MATSLELAITAIRSNRKDEGRQLLNLLIQENPNNELAWLWMSSVVNTDEQRARCLYHVLAINPDNQVARRGLQLLGIVVSDSRPVRVPRDSQPIKIPNPSPPQAQFLPDTQPMAETQPESANPQPAPLNPTSAPERRPFRLDPQAIVAELPFKPITKPFAEIVQPAAESGPTQAIGQDTQAATPLEPAPAVQVNSRPETVAAQPGRPLQAQPAPSPSEPVPVIQPTMTAQDSVQTGNLPHPSQPVPVTQTDVSPEQAVLPGTAPWSVGAVQQPRPDTGPLPGSGPQQPATGSVQPMSQATQSYPPQMVPVPQQFGPGVAPIQDTRPSQPVPVTFGQNPSQPVPMTPSSPTMGMAIPYGSAQGYSQPVSPLHANTTMGMPMPAQYPSGSGGAPPSEPVPVIHANTAMGMPAYYGQPQVQQPLPQNQAGYAEATMLMPAGNFFAAPAPPYQSGMVDYRVANPGSGPNVAKTNPPQVKDNEEGEEINVLAVIIFGSLSVTALGGLGMLILLMFAT
ncbi:MAG: hypothetical protein JW953_14690 [Anaerolineae bacterium]|nr:hypothetical protein [Anaerolineae bacterium]